MKLEYKILNKPKYRWTGEWIHGRRKYILINSVDIVINGVLYVIPAGFVWDGWSIPLIIYNFFDLTYDLIPALIHDYFYEMAGIYPEISRNIADTLLRNIAIDRGCIKREVYIAYYVVKLVSGHIWRKYKRHNLGIKELPEDQYSHITFNPHKKGKA